MSRLLTKSRYKLALECPTKLFCEAHPERYPNEKEDDPFLRELARGGFQVGALAQLYFPGGSHVDTLDPQAALDWTRTLLTAPRATLYEAAFTFETCFIRADILVKDHDLIRLYEVKAKSIREDTSFWTTKGDDLVARWVPYLSDVAFQHWVIRNARPDLKVVPYLCLADRGARTTVDGLNQRFRIAKRGKRTVVDFDRTLGLAELGGKLTVERDVTREVEHLQRGSFAEEVRRLAAACHEDRRLPPTPSSACRSCEFDKALDECWTEALALAPGTLEKRRPLFEVGGIRTASFFAEGVHFVDQLTEDDVNARQAIQLRGIPYFDKAGFDEVRPNRWPLHFIDFETTMVAIPFTKGRHPYETVAYQFSHHTLDESGLVCHAGEWLSATPGEFPNFEFVRRLKASLGRGDGPIFRYAMHENSVLNHIRTQLLEERPADYVELVAFIQSITHPTKELGQDAWAVERPMIDMLAWVKRFFWHPRMKGSNSIKVVLPAVLEASPFLQEKYSRPLVGASHFPEGFTVFRRNGKGEIDDPYQSLPPVFEGHRADSLDRYYEDEDLRDGGAAMMAYAKLQFTEMTPTERTAVSSALLRYCELDTLAMVLVYEAFATLPAMG